MFSPFLSGVPETVWLPPEIRSRLENSERSKPEIHQQLNALLERLNHIDSLLVKLNVEPRLKRLETCSVSTRGG